MCFAEQMTAVLPNNASVSQTVLYVRLRTDHRLDLYHRDVGALSFHPSQGDSQCRYRCLLRLRHTLRPAMPSTLVVGATVR